MALGKRLINTGAAAAACSTDSVQAFGADNAYSSNIALYQLDSDGGVTNNVPDTTTNYNGTASNVTYASGHIGNAAVFNGTNSYISISATNTTPLDLSQENYSISAWVKFDTFSGDRAIISKWGGSASLRSILWWVSNGSIKFIEGGSADSIHSSTATLSSTGTWYHLVYIRSASESKIFINGSLDSTFARTHTIRQGGAEPYYLGSQSAGVYKNLDGSLDQVRIFDKAISAEDVATLYAETTSTASNTNPFSEGAGVALYTMDYDASEASGYYDGVPTNVEFGVGGKINYGARFNGSSSYIDLGTSLLGSRSAFSVSTWVNFDNLNTQNFIFYNSESGTGGNVGFYDFGNGSIYFQPDASTSANRGYISNSGIYTTDEWVHIVMVFDGSATGNSNRLKAYIQGTERTLTYDGTIPSSTGTSTANSWIGGRASTKFSGDIDQVRVFSKALSSDEVDSLFAETACVYTATTTDNYYPLADGSSDAVAYYKLDNSSEDYVGSNDVTDTNIEYRFGRFGQAAVFNGSSSRLDIPNVLTGFTDTYSFSIWVKIDNVNNFPFFASDPTSLASTNNMLFVLHQNGNYYFDFGNNSSARMTGVTPSEWRDNNWHHFVFVSTSTQKLAYVDGSLFNTLSSTTAISGKSTLTVGHYLTNYGGGLYDQVRIYSTALSSSQVTELYNEKPEVDTSNFKAVLWNMDGVDGRYISNVGFQPDFVWIKDREDTSIHVLFDSIRGATNYLSSSSTAAEASASTTLQSFEANGFTLGNSGAVNDSSGNGAVAWVWKGGGDDVLNEVGDIDSQVSANTEAGFSIVKWTGNNLAGQTIGHGLTVDGVDTAPEIIIIKKLTGTALDWQINLNSSITGTEGYLNFNTVALYTTFPNYYTSANSTVLSTNGTTTAERQYNNQSADYIAYCFHSVAGYSKIGSYTGNGSSTGPIVYTTDDGTPSGSNGFEPRWVMIKRTDDTGNWYIVDSIRSTANPRNDRLLANTSNFEVSYTPGNIDFLSNGFQLKGTYNSTNALNGTYIYMAFK